MCSIDAQLPDLLRNVHTIIRSLLALVMWSACLTRWCKWWECPRWVVEGCSLRVLQCELEGSGRHTRGWGYWGKTDWESSQGPAEVYTTQQHMRSNIDWTATHQHTTLYIHNTYIPTMLNSCIHIICTQACTHMHSYTYSQWRGTVNSCKRNEYKTNDLQDSKGNGKITSAQKSR